MAFIPIDFNRWSRKEYYEHYFKQVPCTYSMQVELDITALRKRHVKLYPAMLFALTTIVNRHTEFRMSNENNQLGYFDTLIPCYTIFHADNETFSNLWTEYSENYLDFKKNYDNDIQVYGNKKGFMPKPNLPQNHFNVSMIPWTTFQAFQFNIKDGFDYLRPIFTMGKWVEKNQIHLPFSMQVHHAVCDGFHACRFVNELQDFIHTADWIEC